MRRLPVVAIALSALAVAVPAAGGRAGGPRVVKACASKAQRPSPVRAHRRRTSKARITVARCARSRLIGTLGGVVAGAPSSFAAGAPFVPVSAAPAAAPAASPAPSATPVPDPTLPAIPTNPRALQVQAFEFGLQLSKGTVLSGDVRIEFNSSRAQDPHNLVAVRADGTGAPVQFGQQASGAVSTKTVTLTPGRWTLFCSLAGHQAAGMQATLTVSG